MDILRFFGSNEKLELITLALWETNGKSFESYGKSIGTYS